MGNFRLFYHACARTHTSVYFGPILLLHEYTLHSYTTKYTLHYVYCSPARDVEVFTSAPLAARVRVDPIEYYYYY